MTRVNIPVPLEDGQKASPRRTCNGGLDGQTHLCHLSAVVELLQ